MSDLQEEIYCSDKFGGSKMTDCRTCKYGNTPWIPTKLCGHPESQTVPRGFVLNKTRHIVIEWTGCKHFEAEEV
jgi:hypothetical protein